MSSPLLLLLDGYLSQDDDRVRQALEAMTGQPMQGNSLLPPDDLVRVVSKYLETNSQVASIRSSHDESLPLHFAASFGNVALAELIWKHVSVPGSDTIHGGESTLLEIDENAHSQRISHYLTRQSI